MSEKVRVPRYKWIYYCWSCSWETNKEKEYNTLSSCGCPFENVDIMTMECCSCGHEEQHDYEDGCWARFCPKCGGEVKSRIEEDEAKK